MALTCIYFNGRNARTTGNCVRHGDPRNNVSIRRSSKRRSWVVAQKYPPSLRLRLSGAGPFRRTKATRSSQMRLIRVIGDSLPIATGIARRDTVRAEEGYSIQQWDTRACACRAMHFMRWLSLSLLSPHARVCVRFFTISLPFSFLPVLASVSDIFSFLLSRIPSCSAWSTNARLRAYSSVSFPRYASASLILSFFPCPCSSLRSLSLACSLACAWKRCHPSVERCCHRFVPLLLGEYLRSSSWVFCSGFQLRLTRRQRRTARSLRLGTIPDDFQTRRKYKRVDRVNTKG